MPDITQKQMKEKIKNQEQAIDELTRELEQVKRALKESEERYQNLFEHGGFSINLMDAETGDIVAFNRAEYENLGYTKREFENMSLGEMVANGDPEERKEHRKIIDEKGSHFFETRHRTKDGKIRHKLMSAVAITIDGKRYHQNISSDITYLKQVEEELKDARNKLEERVHQRTAELVEANTALKVLLQKQNEAMQDVEERLLENTRQLVVPYIENLKKSPLNERQMANLIELELNLRDIVSPFLKRISNQFIKLTPAEIRVAALIREGKTSKEIADLLNVSIKAIEGHRSNLRKKMGLKHKKINLQSHLRSLGKP